MPLLIDGHNLIGRMPDLSLEDADDEAALVRRVRRYCLRYGRRATVVFDAGLPGGRASHLSSAPVQVVFAPPGTTADCLIAQRIRRARDPRGLVVISSDRAVQEAALAGGARVMRSEEFAARLVRAGSTEDPKEQPPAEGEVQEWLELFGRP